MKLYVFRTVPLSIIRSYSLYTQQWYMSYRQLSCSSRIRMEPVPFWSCSKAVYKPVWHIPLLSVQWITPDDGQRNCPKHVEFHSQNKFEKLVHLVGFIIRKESSIHPYNKWHQNPWYQLSKEACDLVHAAICPFMRYNSFENIHRTFSISTMHLERSYKIAKHFWCFPSVIVRTCN
jgi:hypothetical protein